ncbi:MAG: RNA methyltransferase, partial [Methanobacteriales archaeon HGW-Methanobacteriales-2]
KKYIEPEIDYDIIIPVKNEGTVSAIKITTFTLLTPDFICGPTPMMNPPLLIPTNHLKVKGGENIILKLKYIMGGGLDTIRASFEAFS